jgi:thermitase
LTNYGEILKSLSYLRRLSFIFAALILAGLIFLPALPAAAEPPAPDNGPVFKEGEVLVRFKTGLGRSAAAKALPDKSMALGESIEDLGIYKVQVTAGHELEAVASLRSRSDVAYAAPNYQVHALEEPDDSFYSSQWAYPIIQAPRAWDITTGSSAVIIAIVDSGVDLTHPDLVSKLVAGYDYIDNDSTPQDLYGHGTHVAGIAAAATDNGLGVAGTSWGARIMPVRVLDASGRGYDYQIIQGIQYAADNGARIINLSLGREAMGYPDNYVPAINYARSKGALVVAAGGNCGDPIYYASNGCSEYNAPIYPAANEGVLAVAATDDDDYRSSFSNQGSYIDVAAPGSSIFSTYLSSDYRTLGGTSMATPFVSGLASLIWSTHRSMTIDEVEQLIKSSADDLGSAGFDNSFGWGRINLYRAQTLSFRATDESGPSESYTIPIINPTDSPMNWTASKNASWLTLSDPSGTVDPHETATITATASRTMADGEYGIYEDTISITRALSGGPGQPQTYNAALSYVLAYYFPILGRHTP